jgi:hypothetical protein
MLCYSVISAVLLRYRRNDVGVWKIVQSGLWMTDAMLLVGTWMALDGQGRLSWKGMRMEDWACIGITGLAGLARTCFVLGLGVGGVGGRERKKRA